MTRKTMCLTLTNEEAALLQALAGDAAVAWPMLNALRAGEGDTVTLCCDNPDFEGPNNIVEACGAWTDWADRRFEGGSIVEAITAAWRAKRAAEAG